MFIKITKSGPRQYIHLFEAYLDGDGTTRHREVANLGRLDKTNGKLDRLIDGLSRASGRAPPEAPTFERALEVGGPWVLSSLWNRLGLLRRLRGLTRADANLDLDALTRVIGDQSLVRR